MSNKSVQEKNQRLQEHMLALRDPSAWDHTLALTEESLRRFSGDPRLRKVRTVLLLGHGTSYATALNAEFFFSHLAGVNARAITAYQFRQYAPDYMHHPEETLVVGISSGGNTVSVVEGLKSARALGALTMCLSHEQPNKLSEAADFRVNADTRIEDRAQVMAYSVSHEFLLAAAYQTALMLGEVRGVLDAAAVAGWREKFRGMLRSLSCLPSLWEQMRDLAAEFRSLSRKNVIVLGTGPNLGTMQEGALKICEFAWLFCAGEELEDFAHGRFREVDGQIPLFFLSPDEKTYAKTMDILTGCALSGTPAVVFTGKSTPAMDKLSSRVVLLPELEETLTPFLYVFAMWFFGFHVRSMEGEVVGEKRFGLFASDIDFPAHFDASGNRLA
jgi:glucosamine 6-phosphate synthetase-like amidotransferase/phosphosugar isomerase protein